MIFKSRFIRPIHLFLGLLSGVVVLTVGLTGAIYAFEREFRNLLYKDLLFVTEAVESRRSLEELMLSAKNQNPGIKLKNIRIYRDRSRSIEINLANKRSLYLNPYTGEFLGSIKRDKDFFGVVLNIHRSLNLGDPGKRITGISALIFLIMLITGLVLWWPQNRRLLKQKFTITKTVHYQKRILDIHSVLGFYASWILIFTTLTGLVWSYKWAENSIYLITGSKNADSKKIQSSYTTSAGLYSMSSIYNSVNASTPEAVEYSIAIPADSTGAVRVIVQNKQEGFFKKQDILYFDQYGGQLLKDNSYAKSSLGDKIKNTNFNIHTGKVLGLPGQFLVFFAGLIAASLPITGFLIWWSRNKTKK